MGHRKQVTALVVLVFMSGMLSIMILNDQSVEAQFGSIWSTPDPPLAVDLLLAARSFTPMQLGDTPGRLGGSGPRDGAPANLTLKAKGPFPGIKISSPEGKFDDYLAVTLRDPKTRAGQNAFPEIKALPQGDEKKTTEFGDIKGKGGISLVSQNGGFLALTGSKKGQLVTAKKMTSPILVTKASGVTQKIKVSITKPDIKNPDIINPPLQNPPIGKMVIAPQKLDRFAEQVTQVKERGNGNVQKTVQGTAGGDAARFQWNIRIRNSTPTDFTIAKIQREGGTRRLVQSSESDSLSESDSSSRRRRR